MILFELPEFARRNNRYVIYFVKYKQVIVPGNDTINISANSSGDYVIVVFIPANIFFKPCFGNKQCMHAKVLIGSLHFFFRKMNFLCEFFQNFQPHEFTRTDDMLIKAVTIKIISMNRVRCMRQSEHWNK